MSNTITIKVNESPKEINAELSVAELIAKLRQSDKGIAVAINNEVINRDLWTDTNFNQNDNILIIQATQGG